MLLERASCDVTAAVDRLGGLQAQEPKPPFLALWSRLEAFDAEALLAALRAGDAVRATLMRATLHTVSATAFRTLRPALGPAMDAAMAVLRGRDQGLDLDAVLPKARELVEAGPRTFNELRALLAEAFPGVDERALGYAVRLHLPLAMVPTDDRWGYARDSRFALGPKPHAAPDAEALVRFHLAAFGPASAADVQRWSGLKRLAPVLDGMRDELAVLSDERGRELFDLPGAPRPPEDAPAPPRLLPEFDSLVLAHDDRSRIVADDHRAQLVTKNLRVRATFLHDGFAAGTWKAERKGRRATLTLSPFARVPKRGLAALEAEAEALLRFAEPDAASHDVRVEG